eukprot:367215_1
MGNQTGSNIDFANRSSSTLSIQSRNVKFRQSYATSSDLSAISELSPSKSGLSPSKPGLPPSKSKHHYKKSSLLNVYNGITGEYISSRICKIAANFWQKHIVPLSVTEQLEIGCSIFFSMLTSNSEIKQIIKYSNKTSRKNENIEKTSLKYLDMMGWLIRHLVTDKIDLYVLLLKLGTVHQSLGVSIKHFAPMLQSMHDTFSYYFTTAYNIEVKYAMDEIFSLAAQVMTGEALKCNQYLNDITQQFQENQIPFLENLQVCLKSSIGREYLYRYLAQTWCDEISMFLKSLYRFKDQLKPKDRFTVAKEITELSIKPTATFCLNLSYSTRMNAMNKMKVHTEKFLSTEQFQITKDFFANVEHETYKLIMNNHWKSFVEKMEILQAKSFHVE